MSKMKIAVLLFIVFLGITIHGVTAEPCKTHEDCKYHEICVEGKCITKKCLSDYDCPQEAFCRYNNSCWSECKKGVCQMECGICPKKCENGRCVPECKDSKKDCPASWCIDDKRGREYVCKRGSCYNILFKCINGVCKEGKCEKSCSSNIECGRPRCLTLHEGIVPNCEKTCIEKIIDCGEKRCVATRESIKCVEDLNLSELECDALNFYPWYSITDPAFPQLCNPLGTPCISNITHPMTNVPIENLSEILPLLASYCKKCKGQNIFISGHGSWLNPQLDEFAKKCKKMKNKISGCINSITFHSCDTGATEYQSSLQKLACCMGASIFAATGELTAYQKGCNIYGETQIISITPKGMCLFLPKPTRCEVKVKSEKEIAECEKYGYFVPKLENRCPKPICYIPGCMECPKGMVCTVDVVEIHGKKCCAGECRPAFWALIWAPITGTPVGNFILQIEKKYLNLVVIILILLIFALLYILILRKKGRKKKR